MWLGAVCFLLFRLDSSKGWWICCFIHNTHLHEGKHIGFFCVCVFHFHNIQIILCLSGCTLNRFSLDIHLKRVFGVFFSSAVWYKNFGENFQNVSKFGRIYTRSTHFFKNKFPNFVLKMTKIVPKNSNNLDWPILFLHWSFWSWLWLAKSKAITCIFISPNVVSHYLRFELHPNYYF
jgi:hypothetical protein